MDQITGRHIRPRQIHYLKLKKKKKRSEPEKTRTRKEKAGTNKDVVEGGAI